MLYILFICAYVPYHVCVGVGLDDEIRFGRCMRTCKAGSLGCCSVLTSLAHCIHLPSSQHRPSCELFKCTHIFQLVWHACRCAAAAAGAVAADPCASTLCIVHIEAFLACLVARARAESLWLDNRGGLSWEAMYVFVACVSACCTCCAHELRAPDTMVFYYEMHGPG